MKIYPVPNAHSKTAMVLTLVSMLLCLVAIMAIVAGLSSCSPTPTATVIPRIGGSVDIRPTATQTVAPTPTTTPTATPTATPESEPWEILNSLPKRNWSVQQLHEPQGYVVKMGQAVRFEITCGNTLTQKIITVGAAVPPLPTCNERGFTKNILLYWTSGDYNDLIRFLKSDMASYAKTTAYPLVYQETIAP